MRAAITGLGVASALAAMAAGPARAANAGTELDGRWATEGFGSIVEFRPCARAPADRCGRIVWLWAPAPDGRARVDERNPDPAFRSRPIVGTEIVSGLRESSPRVWTGGRLYNPDDGRTYAGTVRLKGGLLELKGCALGVVCRKQTWRRPQDVLAAAEAR
ncbi:MAG: DUF2147 domain-containing protein [Phenylobacterium sp.]|uniref:DUF2147 domain-containing protein n=1 Tax=Phenylobacterium sp. TaxID=1871053 RepID=UPI001A28C027|nr:DUF2147 domain-containing protein [Phenylobacterium sp.]MBJ7411020.1 DUF2147 domain-containing protein [Phenylobacterium sp.]